MAADKREASRHTEIERKFAVTDATVSPSFAGLASVARVERSTIQNLDAVYFDTPGHDLAGHHITLRRRTGGPDEHDGSRCDRETGRDNDIPTTPSDPIRHPCLLFGWHLRLFPRAHPSLGDAVECDAEREDRNRRDDAQTELDLHHRLVVKDTNSYLAAGLADLGTSIVSTPLSKRAVMLSACTSPGSAIRRW